MKVVMVKFGGSKG